MIPDRKQHERLCLILEYSYQKRIRLVPLDKGDYSHKKTWTKTALIHVHRKKAKWLPFLNVLKPTRVTALLSVLIKHVNKVKVTPPDTADVNEQVN